MRTQITNNFKSDTFKRVAIAVVLILTTAAFSQVSTPHDEKQQALENERQRRLIDEQWSRLIRQRQLFVDNVQSSQLLLAELAGTAELHFRLMEALLTNDDGKRIASNPKWFISYRMLDENPVVRLEEITPRLKAITSILKELQSDEDAVAIGFLPSTVTQEEVAQYKFWATDRLARLKQQQNILKEILDNTSGSSDVSNLITLSKAMQQYDAKWHEILRDSDILGQQLALEESKKILVEASHVALLKKTAAEAEKIKLQTQAEIESQKLDYEFKLMQQQQEAAQARYDAEKARDDLLAELDYYKKLDEARRKAKAIEGGLIINETLNAAIHKQLIAKAQTQEVQQLLAPFIAKGYYQPGLYKPAFERQAVSLSKLIEFGALEPNMKGLDKLVLVATKKKDKERPRWPYTKYMSRLKPDELTRIKQAQAYLIELGDVMVELGMLAP